MICWRLWHDDIKAVFSQVWKHAWNRPKSSLFSHQGQVQKVSASIFLAVAWATSVGSSLALQQDYDNLMKKKKACHIPVIFGYHGVTFYIFALNSGPALAFGLVTPNIHLESTQHPMWPVRPVLVSQSKLQSPEPCWTMDLWTCFTSSLQPPASTLTLHCFTYYMHCLHIQNISSNLSPRWNLFRLAIPSLISLNIPCRNMIQIKSKCHATVHSMFICSPWFSLIPLTPVRKVMLCSVFMWLCDL